MSGGRAGVRVQAGSATSDPAHFGRRSAYRPAEPDDPGAAGLVGDLFDETADYVEVVRRLWDSWRTTRRSVTAANRSLHRYRPAALHRFRRAMVQREGSVDHAEASAGSASSACSATALVPYRLAGRVADIVYVTPHDEVGVGRIRDEIRVEQAGAGRADEPLFIFADLVVFLDDETVTAESRKHRLDDLDGAEYSSDAQVFVGDPDRARRAPARLA